jgi:hypothetical protein
MTGLHGPILHHHPVHDGEIERNSLGINELQNQRNSSFPPCRVPEWVLVFRAFHSATHPRRISIEKIADCNCFQRVAGQASAVVRRPAEDRFGKPSGWGQGVDSDRGDASYLPPPVRLAQFRTFVDKTRMQPLALNRGHVSGPKDAVPSTFRPCG